MAVKLGDKAVPVVPEEDQPQQDPLTWLDKAADVAKSKQFQPLAEIKKKKLMPSGEWVLIRQLTVAGKITDGGLVLTEAEKRSNTGHVVEAGPSSEYEKNDLVIYTGFPITLEDVEYMTGDKELHLVRAEEIYARLVDLE